MVSLLLSRCRFCYHIVVVSSLPCGVIVAVTSLRGCGCGHHGCDCGCGCVVVIAIVVVLLWSLLLRYGRCCCVIVVAVVVVSLLYCCGCCGHGCGRIAVVAV